MNVEINGARIFFEIPILGGIPITETMLNAWCVMAVIIGLCIWLTHGLKVRPTGKKQIVAEFLVQTAQKFVVGNMGEKFRHMVPFVSAIFATSVLCSLSSLIGAYPATSDLSTELAWAVVVFIMVSLDTVRLLAYARMSEEIERLLDQGYASPAERRILDEMHRNYKAHGWNGDMDARLEKVYRLRTDHAED